MKREVWYSNMHFDKWLAILIPLDSYLARYYNVATCQVAVMINREIK